VGEAATTFKSKTTTGGEKGGKVGGGRKNPKKYPRKGEKKRKERFLLHCPKSCKKEISGP